MNTKTDNNYDQQISANNFGIGEFLIIGWLVIIALFFVVIFGSYTVSFQFARNLDVIFTKWYSCIVFFILPPILLLRSKSRYVLPGVIFYLWFLCFMLIIIFTASTWVYISDSRIRIGLYYSAHFWGFDIVSDILKIIFVSITAAATIYLIKSKRYK